MPVPYPIMHHFITEMCTSVHISVTKWCIVGYLSNELWDLWDGLIVFCYNVWYPNCSIYGSFMAHNNQQWTTSWKASWKEWPKRPAQSKVIFVIVYIFWWYLFMHNWLICLVSSIFIWYFNRPNCFLLAFSVNTALPLCLDIGHVFILLWLLTLDSVSKMCIYWCKKYLLPIE